MLGSIRAVATVLTGRRNFFFVSVNNARFRRFPVGNISRNLNTTTSIGEAVTKTFGTEFWKFYLNRSSFSEKINTKITQEFPDVAISGRHNSAMITDRPKVTTKMDVWNSIFTVRISLKSFPWDVRRVQERYLPKFPATFDVRYCVKQYAAVLPGGPTWKKSRPELETENK